MRLLNLVAISTLLIACHRPLEESGLYVAADRAAYLFPCDQANTTWQVSDSALARSYRAKATRPTELLFVRLRGVRSDSGSVYGGQHHFLVQQILEIRPRRDGECPSVPDTVPSSLFAAPTVAAPR